MQLESFPLTANGKVDKRALPEPLLQVEEYNKKIAATNLQRTLCEIFAKALGRKVIGADENFFEIGCFMICLKILRQKYSVSFKVN